MSIENYLIPALRAVPSQLTQKSAMKALSEYIKSATPFGFACLLFFAFWQGAPLPVSAQENSGMTLRGRVSGQDENGVSLGVIPKATVEFANADGSSAGKTEANDTGYYEIKGILPGAYTYRVSAAGYIADDIGRGVVIPEGAVGPVFDFILTQGELNLPKSGTLSGFAWEEKDGKRSPMQGVQISARMEAGNRFVTDYTDAEGAYTFTVPVGDWKASALALGMEPQVNPDVVTVKPDAPATVDFIFSPAKPEVPSITNRVYALASVPAGAAGADPEVNFLNRETGGTSPGKVSLVTAEQLGGLGLPGDALSGTLTWYQAEPTSPLAPGTYFAEGTRKGFPAAQSPEKPISSDGTTWFDIAFVPEGSGDDGDMTDTDTPVTSTEPLLSGVRGRVSGQNEKGEYLGIVAGAIVEVLDGAGNVGGKATTNETGYYEMIGLASGKWVYRVTAPDYAADDAGRGFILEEGSGIQVFDYILTQKLAEPSLTGVVRGNVWKGEGQGKTPLPGTMISLRPEAGGAIRTTMTDDDGAYRMDLPATNWQASALTGDFRVSVYPSTLTIAAGGEAQADFTFPADDAPPVTPVDNVYILTSVEKGKDGKTRKPVINLVSDDGQSSIPAIVEPIPDTALAGMGIAGASADKSWDWYGAKPSVSLPVGNYSARGQSEGCVSASTETKAVGESISVTFDLTLSRERAPDDIPPVPPLMTGIRGQVSGKNETGAPLGVVSGATVEMLDETGKVAAKTMTNERGLYELAGLPAGNWTYRVTASTYEPEDAGRGFNLAEGAGVKELDFTLLQKLAGEPLPGYIYGTVWQGEGQARAPLAGTTISLRPAAGGSIRTVTTDANGAYRLEVAPSNWQVSALTSDFKASNFPSVVSVAPGGEVAADFIFAAGDTPPIVPLGGVYVLASVETGEGGGSQDPQINFVSGDGQSIPATVEALSSDQQAAMGIASEGGGKPWDWYVATPSQPLPEGSYRAVGQADDYVPASTDPKEVRNSMSVSFLLDLRRVQPPSPISITVTSAENSPLEGASVKLVKKPGDVSLSEAPGALTDANGVVSGSLEEGFGEYDLMVSLQGYKPQRGMVTFDETNLSHTVRLETLPEFSITAVNSAGELLPGVAVRMTTKANEENLELGGVVETNAEGMYAQPLDESIYGQYVYLANLDGYEPKRGDFVVDEANHSLTITLEALSGISITVTCTENNPLEGASVKLVKKPGDVTLSEASVSMTDANGVISGILPEGLGEYDVLVSLQGYKPQRGAVTFDKANLSHTIRLEELPGLSITVTDSAGTPLPQVSLRLIGKADEASLEQIAGLQMNEEGAFSTSVEESQFGEYVYLASLEGYQTKRGGFTLDEAHLSHVIKLEAPIAVSITVTGNENTPLEGVSVKLVKKSGDAPLSESTGLMRAEDGSAGLLTDAGGAVSVLLTEGFGEYDLMASLQGYKPNRETVTFDASNLSRNVRMDKTPEFSITAVNSAGELLPGVVVKMVAKANEAGLDEAGSVTTNETGEYSQALDESQFGQYVFLASLEGYQPKRGEFSVDQANHSFTIILEAPAAISITVTCTENNPLEGAVVKLVKKPADVTLAETSGAKTSVNGVISGVLPEGFGEYDVLVSLEGYKTVRGPFTFDEANLALTVKLEEEADWIRMILTEGWGDIQRSLQFHQNGVNAEPEDSNVDYALGLSALKAGDTEQAPGAFVQAVGKVNETGWWDRACEGYIWTLMSLNQENVAAREITRLVSAQYGTREGSGAATQTVYLFGVAVGVMNGPWKNEGTAAAYAQLDQSVTATLKEPLLTAYLQGRGSVVSDVPQENPESDRMKDGLQTEVNRLNLRIQTIVDTEHPQVVAAIAAAENAPPGEGMQPNNNAGMKENLDARWKNLEMMLGNQIAGYDAQINGISEQIIGIDGQLADLANNPPVCQECRNNGETVGNPAECPGCAQALERERIKLNLARNQLVAQITNIEPMKAAVVKQLEDAWTVYQNQLAQLNQPGEPQPNPAMNTNLAALIQRKTDLETEYNTIQTQLVDLTNRINEMGRPDPDPAPGEARKPFSAYLGYPIEERRQELLNSLSAETPATTR